MIKKPSSFNVLMCTLLLVFFVLSCRTRSGQKVSKESDKKSAVDIDAEKTEEIADTLINAKTSVLDPVKLNKKALKSEVNQLTVGGSKRVITVKTTLNPVDQPHAEVELIAESGKSDKIRKTKGDLVIGAYSNCLKEGGVCRVITRACTDSAGKKECGASSSTEVILAPDEADSQDLTRQFEKLEDVYDAKWNLAEATQKEACAYKKANPKAPTDPSQKKMHDLKVSFCHADSVDNANGFEKSQSNLESSGDLSDAEITGIVIASVLGGGALLSFATSRVSRRDWFKAKNKSKSSSIEMTNLQGKISTTEFKQLKEDFIKIVDEVVSRGVPLPYDPKKGWVIEENVLAQLTQEDKNTVRRYNEYLKIEQKNPADSLEKIDDVFSVEGKQNPQVRKSFKGFVGDFKRYWHSGTKAKITVGASAFVFTALITTAAVCLGGYCLANEKTDTFMNHLLQNAKDFIKFDKEFKKARDQLLNQDYLNELD